MEAILFCGIQATGKTRFFTEQFLQSHVRISMDLLKTRNREEQFLHLCLKTKQPFVVDNTNPERSVREKYIRLAKEHGFEVKGYYFQSKIADALKRNGERSGSARIPDIGVLSAYNRLELPAYDEGFDRLYFVEIDEDLFTINNWKDAI